MSVIHAIAYHTPYSEFDFASKSFRALKAAVVVVIMWIAMSSWDVAVGGALT